LFSTVYTDNIPAQVYLSKTCSFQAVK
jgi:hypothetical protein